MIILPSGSSQTFTLNAWEQLIVTSRGGTTVTGPIGLLGTVSGTSTFGGYSVDTVITIEAVMNDCHYGVAEPENAQTSTDTTNNNNTVITGPDGLNINLSKAMNALITAICGNSIAEACKKANDGSDSSYWSFKNTVHHANTLAGAPMRFKRLTATTRGDAYGAYGYGGATLTTINADILTQWIAQFTATTGNPELVVGYGLLENSIAGGHSVATMRKDVNTWLRIVQNSWPGAIVLLGTPHPSFSYDTAAEVSAYQAMRDYILSLDDGKSIFVTRCDAYENPSIPGTPLGTSGAPLYTDATVHPNARGAFLIARDMAVTLSRIVGNPRHPFRVYSNNLILNGTQAATGTNTTGTMPNPAESTGVANAVRVITAEQPGVLVQVTNTVGGYFDTGTISGSWDTTVPVAAQLSQYAVVEIVSGAENIGLVSLAPQFYDGATTWTLFPLRFTPGDGHPDYQNGDLITIVAPPEVTNHLAFTRRGTQPIRVHPHANCPAGGSYSFRVISVGCMEVS